MKNQISQLRSSIDLHIYTLPAGLTSELNLFYIHLPACNIFVCIKVHMAPNTARDETQSTIFDFPDIDSGQLFEHHLARNSTHVKYTK